MKFNFKIFLFILWGGLISCSSPMHESKLTDYINPLYRGNHINPSTTEIALPFGSIRLSPHTLCGIQSLALYPANCTKNDFNPQLHFIPFNKKDILFNQEYTKTKLSEYAKPGYYKAIYNTNEKTESAVTEHCCIMYYQYSSTDSHGLLINPSPSVSQDSIITNLWMINPRKIEGFHRYTYKNKQQDLYFVVEFSQDCKIIAGDKELHQTNGDEKFCAKNSSIYIVFKGESNRILVKCSISSVNIEGAEANLNKEISHWSFDKIEKDASLAWKKEVEKIKVQSKNQNHKSLFYNSLYYVLLSPNILSDINGNYIGNDNKVHSTNNYIHYNTYSDWEKENNLPFIFQALYRKRMRDILKSCQKNLRYKTTNDEILEDSLTKKCRSYVYQSLGLKSIQEGGNTIYIGIPKFEKITLATARDKRFNIIVSKESAESKTIKEIYLNKKHLAEPQINLKDILRGGKLTLTTTE